MDYPILFVDDDPNILTAYTRVLRKQFKITTAPGGEEGLQVIQTEGPFAAVVADMRMPGMDGIAFLGHVRNFNSDTVRIMLTGNADMTTAVEAVNQGNIFRFLTKPCDPELLASTLEAAIKQYQLVTSERELLEKTLKGSVDLLVELLSVLDPVSFGRAQTIADRASRVATALGMQTPWEVRLAAVLSQIGVLTVPTGVLTKARSGGILSQGEREVMDRIPEIGSTLLRHIPRLEDVAEIIQYMNKNFNGTGYPPGEIAGDHIPLGARILRAVSDFEDLLPKKRNLREAISDMRSRTAWYDSMVVGVLEQILLSEKSEEQIPKIPKQVTLRELHVGQMLVRGIFTVDGLLVVPEGTVLRPSHMEKMRNFARLSGIQEPIWVIGVEAD